MERDDESRLTEDELHELFTRLFPQGWAGADVMAELAPTGWAASPLAAVFHPSARQLYDESIRMRRNLENLPFKRKEDAPPPPPEPTFEEFEASYEPGPVEPERECQELVGLCLWDIFSANHNVFAEDGRVADLGSMRAGGGFLAGVVNRQGGPKPPPKEEPEFLKEMYKSAGPEQSAMMEMLRKEMVGDGGYTYIDFYMGTHMVGGRADLSPVYEMIFRRLRALGCDWKYVFPRLYAVDFRPLAKAMEDQKRAESGEPEFENYDPSAAFEKEQDEANKDREISELRESLDEAHRESVAAAQDQEPPATVKAYRAVYGDFPEGWPPTVEE
jgi:hypothetical protein